MKTLNKVFMHHHNHYSYNIERLNLAFLVGVILNMGYVIFEAVAGILLKSTALLSDAGHNFSDVLSLILGAIGFWLLKSKPKGQLTYGWKKFTVIAALINSILLYVAVGVILIESVKKIFEPEVIKADYVIYVALIGILINSATALFFFKAREHDLNIKAVFWHMVADALVSVAVVIGGIVMLIWKVYWIDGVLGVIISLVILISTWDLLKESFLMSIDAVPKIFDIDKIKRVLESHPAVKSVHHIHLWAISTVDFALTAHVVLNEGVELEQIPEIKRQLKDLLRDLNINHSTLEFEFGQDECKLDYWEC